MDDGSGVVAGRARRELRRHYEGTLLFRGLVCPVRYIVSGRCGRLLMVVEPAVLDEGGGDYTLMVPSETDAAAQLLLNISEAHEEGEAGESCDRWRAYHTGGERGVWAWGKIEAAKLEEGVCGGEEVQRPNPLWRAEPRLCRELNAHRAAVAEACRRLTGLRVENPVVVGVDEGGIDVRARFGVVRLEFEEEALSEDAAMEQVRRVLTMGSEG